MTNTSCPAPEQLRALVSGELTGELGEALAWHLADCAACARAAEALRAEGVPAADPSAAARTDQAIPADPSGAATVAPEARHAATDETVSGVPPATESFDFLAPPQGPGELGRLGSYRVLKVLGRGGMGVVFHAEDVVLGRQVALKAMLPELANRPGARERFLREARAAATIEHDHIVTIFQVDESRGVPYIAMPLLRGCSLEDWLRGREGQPLPLPLTLKLGREVARGLAAAHARGLIHRDIKPANIFMQSGDRASCPPPGSSLGAASAALTPPLADPTASRVKILDFGLARSSSGDKNLTQSGVILGTPAYMAPEQARSGGKIDARADLFSLGVVLYRLCTGRLPFVGEDMMGTLMALAMDDPPPPRALNPAIPAALSGLVMRLLQKDPRQRPGSADEVVEAIEALEGAPPGAPPAEPAAPDLPEALPHPDPVAYELAAYPPARPTPPPMPRFDDDEEEPAPRRRRRDVEADKVEPAPRRPRREVEEEEDEEPAPRRKRRDVEEGEDDLDLRLPKREETGLSVTSMVLGIVGASVGVVGLCCCGMLGTPIPFVCGTGAIVLGVMGMSRGGRTQAQVGIALGAVAVVLVLVFFAVTLLGMGAGLIGGGFKGRF
jgi:serine/threonine protein kinase